MSAYKIFISSPGDVGRERRLAEQVIRRVAAEFQNRVEVQPYFWEYEPMESTRDYQENIPLTSDFDLVICILWKRLGSPLSGCVPPTTRVRLQSGTPRYRNPRMHRLVVCCSPSCARAQLTTCPPLRAGVAYGWFGKSSRYLLKRRWPTRRSRWACFAWVRSLLSSAPMTRK